MKKDLHTLEQRLRAEPESEELRKEILSACLTPGLEGSALRIRHVAEYLRRFPRGIFARCPFTHIDPVAFPEAFRLVEEIWLAAHSAHPNDPAIARGIALYVAAADRQRAAGLLREALRCHPGDVHAWLDLGRVAPESTERLRALLEARRLGAAQTNLLAWIARAALETGELAVAMGAGNELLSLVREARLAHGEKLDWTERGNACWEKARSSCTDDATARILVKAIGDHANRKHWGHTALGVVALRNGDVVAAREHLLHSAAVVGEPRLSSYGPSFLLARELCARGEWRSVSEYLHACEAFWETELLLHWQEQLERQELPEFPDQ
ncbi:MAG: hypothetical protein ABI895_33965 [Deltaproteobacteria bacterium]